MSTSPLASPSLKSMSNSEFHNKTKKTKKRKRESRDSHHDWASSQNKSIISQENIYNDVHYTCVDKFCSLFSKLPMLSPFGPFRMTWDVLVMFMLIYTSLEVPFTLGFGIELQLAGKYSTFGFLALCIDICLLCDIILNFRTAFFDKYDDLRLITSPKRIAFRYVKGWFVLDLLTSFPFEFILPENENEKGGNFASYVKVLRIFRLFRIFKILRLLKMVKLFDGFVSNVIAREILMIIRLFKVFCFALLAAHMSACLWYYTGCTSYNKYSTSWIESNDIISSNCGIVNDNEQDTTLFIRYSYSWYWSVVTLFTTGYGDIVATNPSEQWIASLVILLGTCLFGYFVGTITSLIVEGDKVSASMVSKLEDAQHFCQQKQLPREMSRAVLTHTRYHCMQNYVLGDESEVLGNLPSYLAMDVSIYISRKYLENLDFLNNKFIDPYTRGLIALKMKSISCNKGYKLFVKGDISEKIYIQRIGKSNLYIYDNGNSKNKPIKKSVKRGDVIGEYALIKKKRDSTLICQTWCEFYVLDVNDIKEILEKHYGSIWIKKYKNIKNFIQKEYMKPIEKRKKRHCLFAHNPLLPSFINTEEKTESNDINYMNTQDINTEEGHCDWGNGEEIKEINNLKKIEKMTNEILNANKSVHDLNNNNINFGLCELSRNAYKISKLTTDKNKKIIKKNILNPLHATSNITLHATKSMLKGLTRQTSFLRDLEVTKDYKYNHDSSSSNDEEVKYNNNQDNNQEKRVTEQVAESIVVEMMKLQNDLHTDIANRNDDDDDDDGDDDDEEMKYDIEGDNENIDDNNIDNMIDDDINGMIDEMIENDYGDDDDDDDDEEEEIDNDNNHNPGTSNKVKKINGIKRKKRKKNHKTHH